jgi:hypothetical protein
LGKIFLEDGEFDRLIDEVVKEAENDNRPLTESELKQMFESKQNGK